VRTQTEPRRAFRHSMPRHAAPGAPRPRPFALGAAGVRVGLGLLWLAAGVLELQPADFAPGFARLDLAQAVMGEPAVVARSILVVLRPFESAWPLWNALVAAVELGFGAVLVAGGVVAARGLGAGGLAPAGRGIARLERPVLVASALVALLFWWVGEGFGGLPTGFAVPLGGAPGPALLYALLALLAWPGPQRADGGPRWQRTVWRLSWALVWWGSALAMVSWTLPAAIVLRANLVENGIGQPALLRAWGDALASAVARAGGEPVALAVGLVALTIGVAAVLPLGPERRPLEPGHVEAEEEQAVRSPGARRLAPTVSRLLLGSGVLLALLAWVFVQDLGGLAAPGGTDVGLGPPLVLLALAGWPRSPGTARRAVARGTESGGGRPGAQPIARRSTSSILFPNGSST